MLEKVIEIIIDQTCAPLAFTLHKFFLYHLPTRGRVGIKLGDAPVGIPPFFFNNYRLVSVEPKFFASSHELCYPCNIVFFRFACCFD